MKAGSMKTAALLLLSFYALSCDLHAQAARQEGTEVVAKMFQAFGAENMEALKLTLADSSLWQYHGSILIPYAGTYKGKEQVVSFIQAITSTVDILDFKIEQMLVLGKTVVVLGTEKQRIKKNSNILEQRWVQVYTVENGLITRMEEFANTAYAEKLFN